MKITTFVAAAALATAASTSFAGDLSPAGTVDNDIIIIPEAPAGSSVGSLGSLGGAAPAIAALVVLGALAASGGS